jgi:hypothetical protein
VVVFTQSVPFLRTEVVSILTRRRKNHLLCNATITLKQSLLGFTIILPHLDGHKVEITRDKITAPGTTLLIKVRLHSNRLDHPFVDFFHSAQRISMYTTLVVLLRPQAISVVLCCD